MAPIQHSTTRPLAQWFRLLPTGISVVAVLALLAYGPIPQFENYHDFADRRAWLGIPNAADVLSNAGLLMAGLAGMLWIGSGRHHPALARGWLGYFLFAAALALTGLGSSFYHWAPDDARLVWDRLPIALLCAGLLAAVRAESLPQTRTVLPVILLAALAVASVGWWLRTADLRPYLLIQLLPMMLIPIWQAMAGAPRADRWIFSGAIACNLASKGAELLDHPIFELTLGWMSGHTLKHLLATIAALLIVGRLHARTRGNNPGDTPARPVTQANPKNP